MTPAPPLVVRLFGPMRVMVHQQPLPRVRRQSAKWLLALLALRSGREIERSWLAGTLWPESQESRARQNLRNDLVELRRALGPEAWRVQSPRPSALTLDLSDVDVDLPAFLAGCEAGDEASLRKAVELYAGPLLEGCYQEWVVPEREALAAQCLTALHALAGFCEERREYAGAVRWLRRAEQIDPLRDSTVRRLMTVLERAGNPAAALETYRTFRDRLNQEMAVDPDRETTLLAREIRVRARQTAARPNAGSIQRLSTRRASARASDLSPNRGEGVLEAAVISGHFPRTDGEPAGAALVTTTFLFTDIEVSTLLWEAHPEAMRRVLAAHDAMLRECIEQRGGTVFASGGDVFCAAFPHAFDALEAATTGQMRLAAEPWPDRIQVKVRMAIDTGAAESRTSDSCDPPLNRGLRLIGMTHGGQILVSHSTHTLVRDSLPKGCSLKSLGLHRLTGLDRLELVFQLCHPALRSDFPPLRFLDQRQIPNNLPRYATRFIGREKELAEVRALVHESRLVTLMGSGGCGKTRLALRTAAEMLGVWEDGVWMVELATVADPTLVAQIAATSLKVREEPGTSILQTLIESLQSKHLLLILDNCEHLVDASARFCHEILRACPQVHILATSRERLSVAGERTYRVPSLSFPGAQKDPNPEHISQLEAVRLFLDRAQQAQPGFRLTERNAPAVASICSRLDGIPLAIEFAAARARSLTVEEINDRLDQRFRLLTVGLRTALPRQQTLRSIIDWSFDLLSEAEQALLCRLSVFSGGWILEAAEQVCSDDVVLVSEVLGLLASLLDKSLIVADVSGAATRYGMLETIREYGRARLEDRGEGNRWRDRHLSYFVALGIEAAPHLTGAHQRDWFQRLEEERDNLRAALDWSVAANPEAGLHLIGAIWGLWQVRNYLTEGIARIAAVLAAAPERPTVERVNTLIAGGALARSAADFALSRVLYEQSLRLSRELRDSQRPAAALGGLAAVLSDHGDYVSARAMFEESLAIRRENDDRQGTATDLLRLGKHAWTQGDFATARACYDEALAISREIRDQWSVAMALNNLSCLALEEDDYPSFHALQAESTDIFKELRDQRSLTEGVRMFGDEARKQGDFIAARGHYSESLSILRDVGDLRGVASSLEGLAMTEAAAGRPLLAARLWGTAERLRERINAPIFPVHLAEYEKSVANAREAVNDDTAFDAAWQTGRVMTMDQAIAMALDDAEGRSPLL